MNSYGHRVPPYPYPKDDGPQYNPGAYPMNPMSHPVNSMGPGGANPHYQSVKYGSRQPHVEPLNYGNNYDKDVPPPHIEYGHPGWSNGNDGSPDYYVNVPPRNAHPPYHPEMKTEYVPTYRPDHTQAQNSWDSPAMGQYSNVRLAIFVENCNCPYELVESDLRELFSYYSGVSSLSISPDYPAAELIVTDQNACSVASSELNGIVLSGIGTLRCVVMRPGQTLSSVLAGANIYQSYQGKPPAQPGAVEGSSRYGYPNDQPPKSGFVNPNPPPGQAKPFSRDMPLEDVNHVSGITDKPNTNRLARFELVELFSFEPDFDVTKTILGPNNANIEYIMKNSNNNIDIRLQGKPLNSAPVVDRLHLSIASSDFVAYNKAIFMVEDLLTSVCEKYVDYVKDRGKVVSNLIGFRRHEYEEDATGTLDYKGYADKPKTWLGQGARRFSPYKSYRGGFTKKVSDRSRQIPGSRPQSDRMASNSRSRSLRK